MKKWLKIGGIVSIVAIVGALAWGSLAFAQGPTGGGPGQGGFGGPSFGPGAFRGGPPNEFGGDPAFGPGGFRGGPSGQFGRGPAFGPGGFGGTIDREALLAEALGITVEELRAAQEKADTAAVQQAVEQGFITQREADNMISRIKLNHYLDRDAMLAKALGITVEEWQQARAESKSLPVLIDELGLDPAKVRTGMQAAFEEAIQQAVTDGIITQEQADQILNGPGWGFGGRGGFHGGFGGRGGFGRSGGLGGFGWQ